MSAVQSVLFVGVGGQGTILASKILTLGLVEKGYDVKMSEVHGMSQRSGSVSTQVRFRKEEEIRKGEAQLRASGAVGAQDNIKILTSCPSCLQGITRYGDDLQTGLLEADYIVIEMAKQILGENWLPEYVQRANNGGIERVLV